ncbi:MAG: hypothetical protein D6800_03175 [Candidatus Zixiibacteriota bacterium]|nr:MAG: hypothetical protein D6800_03175 [candidate division Zixibacteria bacterium]
MRMQDHYADYQSRFLLVPDDLSGDASYFFDPRSKLIILEGPRGKLLAHYLSPLPPDPRRHQFYCHFPARYPVFSGDRPPAQAPADTAAVAWPVEIMKSDSDVMPAGASGLDRARIATSYDAVLMASSPGSNPSQSGLRVGPDHIEMMTPGSTLALDPRGLRVDGQTELRGSIGRGVTRESPLFGILPKTVVTFWAADYLPAVGDLLRYAGMIRNLVSTAGYMQQLLKIFK